MIREISAERLLESIAESLSLGACRKAKPQNSIGVDGVMPVKHID